MEIHVGKLVEERIFERGMSKAEFGRRMNTSRQNVNTLLRKAIWDVRQLVDASSILKMNFFEPFIAVLGKETLESGANVQVEAKGMRVTIEVSDPEQLQDFLEWWKNKER